jgi:hypothetical protein
MSRRAFHKPGVRCSATSETPFEEMFRPGCKSCETVTVTTDYLQLHVLLSETGNVEFTGDSTPSRIEQSRLDHDLQRSMPTAKRRAAQGQGRSTRTARRPSPDAQVAHRHSRTSSRLRSYDSSGPRMPPTLVSDATEEASCGAATEGA